MPLPVDLIVIVDGGAEFRSRPNRLGRIGAIHVAETDLVTLADYFTEAFGLPQTGTLDRLLAALAVLAERGEIKDQYISNDGQVATHCRRAGIGYEQRWFDTQRWRTLRRRVPLFAAIEPNGFLRTLSVELKAADAYDSTFDVFLQEEFSDPGAGYPDVVYSGYSHHVHISYETLTAVADLFADRIAPPHTDRPDESAATILTELVARGELGAHLPPGGNRDRLIAWCAEVSVVARGGGQPRKHEILRADDMVLAVVFWADWRPPILWFTEAYRARDERSGGTEYRVTVPIEDLPVLVDRFEQRLALSPGRGRVDDRLIACFDAMAAHGHLHAGAARQANRDRVAAWITDAGITATVEGFARTEQILNLYRAGTDCLFELVLTLDASAPGDHGIEFREKYEYLPQTGDAGREYSYSVTTPYTSLPTLVAHLETTPGEGDLEERLTRCFKHLIQTGELAGNLDLQVARDRIAARFVQAGVPAITDSSSWINSD
ncbi:hypothetical protein [Actinoplanes auranticolor]|uniref:Uncharacterized protein n=1 Tax=Actinoplanes auranticolor TaxID=47988 RepID=A0A919VRH3_9ACTN|nr:hypothetical protein [Actinoplanes auranticolor]GIM73706.1 hypothetical protein Aau02nite_57270 [Actinoplanes auranticolor]